ncbi:MAG TPA: HEAT repeat domain-containing protein [Candidatus Acidoferrales bacterium]|nr:HEAT repeat domain-containing protein [Candidatus Acidoferrales bacterium]
MPAAEESQALEDLLDALNRGDKPAMRKAVDALTALIDESPALAARLESLLSQLREEKRWPVAYVLASLAPISAPALETLIDALGSTDPDIRWAVSLRLTELARRDPEIRGRLLGLVRRGGSAQRRMAIYGLRDVGLDDAAARQAFLEALYDREPLVRVAAATALRSARDTSGAALSLINVLFHDPDSRVRCAAAMSLARLGEPAAAICAALREGASDPDPQVQKACKAALDVLEKKRPAPPTR